jgi:hypothetical protein
VSTKCSSCGPAVTRTAGSASELTISVKTASAHVSHILRKLDVTSRLEAAEVAHRLSPGRLRAHRRSDPITGHSGPAGTVEPPHSSSFQRCRPAGASDMRLDRKLQLLAAEFFELRYNLGEQGIACFRRRGGNRPGERGAGDIARHGTGHASS